MSVEPPIIRALRLVSGPVLPEWWKPYVYRGNQPYVGPYGTPKKEEDAP
ncbi:hypothetical protein [Arthrobacter sp. VKM Ac-2550]|nr:hypothetical protein [Arthrobacter sp. VKM Ac-2550]MCW2132910.1 hypothetical protein [Arthrobacter sp. VKM Ac-2550]